MSKKQVAILTDGEALNKHIVAVNKAANVLADNIQLALASATYRRCSVATRTT